MPDVPQKKIIHVLEKFGFTLRYSRNAKHFTYQKHIITKDEKKHKIITHVDKGRKIPAYTFKDILKQIQLPDKFFDPADKCQFTKDDYENIIFNLNKCDFDYFGK